MPISQSVKYRHNFQQRIERVIGTRVERTMFSISSTASIPRHLSLSLMFSSSLFATRRLFRSTAKTTAMATATSVFATKNENKTIPAVKNRKKQRVGTLRVVGLDSHGIVAACTEVLNRHDCNIVKHETWTDTRQNMFFQRLSFHYNSDDSINELGTNVVAVDKNACEKDLTDMFPSALKTLWDWRDRRKKLGILVSKYDHCLWDLLLRHKARELDADIEVVISNHETLRPVAETFGIPYHVTPVLKTDKTTTLEDNKYNSALPLHETQQLELLKNVDVVILARYMQVLSSEFLGHFPPDGIINIHHSFLPAFIGGSPYHQAHERGVKLIGATAHYTTEDLDDGPIIEQDVTIVSHRDSVKQLMKKGRVLERNVLMKAIEAHLDDRVIVHGNRCVVFGD